MNENRRKTSRVEEAGDQGEGNKREKGNVLGNEIDQIIYIYAYFIMNPTIVHNHNVPIGKQVPFYLSIMFIAG